MLCCTIIERMSSGRKNKIFYLAPPVEIAIKESDEHLQILYKNSKKKCSINQLLKSSSLKGLLLNKGESIVCSFIQNKVVLIARLSNFSPPINFNRVFTSI